MAEDSLRRRLMLHVVTPRVDKRDYKKSRHFCAAKPAITSVKRHPENRAEGHQLLIRQGIISQHI